VRKTKVVHLTYDMRIGGTETVIKNIVEGLDPERFETEVLCIEPELGPFGQQLQEKGFTITNLHWVGGFDLKLIGKVRSYIKENRVDVLHCHQYTPWVYGCIAALLTDVKVIFTEHGRFYPDVSSWKRKYINPVLLKFTDQVTAISKATKQALVDYEFLPQRRIEVVYNGIAPLIKDKKAIADLRQEYSLPEDAKIVGTVARLDPIKNQTMMIKAFANARESISNLYLLIVGDGEERNTLEALVEQLNIRDYVIFTGYVAKPVNHIALMDAFLLSSLSEGTSMTLLEAMSLGKPCVVTDAGGNAEVVKHNCSGLVSPNNDLDGFSQNLIKTFSAESQTFGVNALTRFESEFSCKKMNDSYIKLYDA